MKPIILCYNIELPTMNKLLRVVTGTEMAIRYDKRYGPIPPLQSFIDGSCLGAFLFQESTEKGVNFYMIAIPEKYDAHVVYHEALHATTRMWYDLGANLEIPLNDEVLTYTMNYIAEYIEEHCYVHPK